MPYSKGDERRYLSFIIAALIVISGAIGYFVWSLVLSNDTFEGVPLEIYNDENGSTVVNPGGSLPTSPPSVSAPTSPPPGS